MMLGNGTWKRNCKRIVAGAAVGVLLGSFMAFAAATDSNAKEADILKVKLPIIEEYGKSMFDFILDPQELLYMTDAARYDGGSVEEGATLLFYNREGEYDFSGMSDRLVITNKSSQPVTVTVSAYITGLQKICISEDVEFTEGENSLYLALVDNQGNEQPVSADGTASICFDMEAMEEEPEEYSFGLAGACNPEADWSGIGDRPKIKIMWQIEPKRSEEKEWIMQEPKETEKTEFESAAEGEAGFGLSTEEGAMSERTEAETVKAEETKTEGVQEEGADAGEIQLEGTEAEEIRTEKEKSEETKTEETKTEETETEETETEETKIEEIKSGERKSEGEKAMETRETEVGETAEEDSETETTETYKPEIERTEANGER